ncbi:hypothetical protein HYS92_01760 [Candidatus Daviesbacteria bacterium]|nr:hypothetical protein [Candidatus Daviesbacteria bacterium]
MVITKKYQDIKPVLMDTKAPRVKEPYFVIDAGHQSIFVLASGQNGVEYNKTEGFVSSYNEVGTFQCLYGQGAILMQRNDEEGEAKEFKVLTLNPGRQFLVPAGWAMCLVNIGKNLLVVLANLDINSKYLDSKPIIEKRGLAYFVVEKKGEIAFEQNLNYTVHPQITTE